MLSVNSELLVLGDTPAKAKQLGDRNVTKQPHTPR